MFVLLLSLTFYVVNVSFDVNIVTFDVDVFFFSDVVLMAVNVMYYRDM